MNQYIVRMKSRNCVNILVNADLYVKSPTSHDFFIYSKVPGKDDPTPTQCAYFESYMVEAVVTLLPEPLSAKKED